MKLVHFGGIIAAPAGIITALAGIIAALAEIITAIRGNAALFGKMTAVLGKFTAVFGEIAAMPERQVVLYTRQGCHLCDDAKAILLRHGLSPREIDIDTDTDAAADLKNQYNECVPVVEIDGQIRFRGRIDERLLKRLLNAQ